MRVLTLFFLNLPFVLFSQGGNEAIYQKLLTDFFATHQQSFNAINSDWPSVWRPSYQLDSVSKNKLIINELEINYERIAPKQFSREILLPINIQGQNFTSEILAFSDTLNLPTLRSIRKAAPPAFKGDAPGRLANTLKPILVSLGSISAVIALFYLRSRN